MKTKEAVGAVAESLPNHIAANLRLLRKRRGWSQAELAERTGLNRGNIASYESGSAEPNICKLLRFSNLFGINARDITRRNLVDDGELALAEAAHDADRLAEKERLAELRNRALELDDLVRSSHRLFENKRQRLDNPCREAQLFVAQYQQLHEVTQQLLQAHRDLLNEVGCQCE